MGLKKIKKKKHTCKTTSYGLGLIEMTVLDRTFWPFEKGSDSRVSLQGLGSCVLGPTFKVLGPTSEMDPGSQILDLN